MPLSPLAPGRPPGPARGPLGLRGGVDEGKDRRRDGAPARSDLGLGGAGARLGARHLLLVRERAGFQRGDALLRRAGDALRGRRPVRERGLALGGADAAAGGRDGRLGGADTLRRVALAGEARASAASRATASARARARWTARSASRRAFSAACSASRRAASAAAWAASSGARTARASA